MNFELSDEQEMLREAARGALARHDTLAAARGALDGEELPDLWPLATDAGWPGLLLSEEDGGAGLDVFDAMLVMQECGRRLASTGLLGHFAATYILRAAGGQQELLGQLASGEARAAAVLARPPAGEEGWTEQRQFVPDVPGADVLVAVTESEGEAKAVLVDPADEGVDIEAVVRYDGSRPLANVDLAGSAGKALDVESGVLANAWHVVQALLAAEALGATEAALELGVEYAKDRHAFGRPIGSYQAVKHQLVEALRGIETTRALTYYAGWAAQDRPDEFGLAASAARRAGERTVDEGSRIVMAVHGGIGATWEHDAHLYFRRAQLSRRLLGGIGDAGERVARELLRAAA